MRTRAEWHLVVVVLATAAVGPALARAQDSPANAPQEGSGGDAGRAEARERFVRGVSAAKDSRWADAEREFAESYARYPHPATLLNWAGALGNLGRLGDAVRTYKRYLHDTRGTDTNGEERSEARRAMKLLAAKMPDVRVLVEGGGGRGYVVELDGATLEREELAEPVAVDPGEHELVLRHGTLTVARETFVITAAEHLTVTLRADATQDSTAPQREPPSPVAAGAAGAAPAQQEPSPGAPLTESPWFWTGVGAGVVGVTALVLVLTLGGGRDATRGNVAPGVTLP